MYDNYEYDKNQIRVQVQNVFYHMEMNLIHSVDEMFDYCDMVDKNRANNHMRDYLSNSFPLGDILIKEKILLTVIDNPDVLYDVFDYMETPDNLTRYRALQDTIKIIECIHSQVFLFDLMIQLIEYEG